MRKLLIKGIILGVLLGCLSGKTFASPPIYDWGPLIKAIAMIESTNNPKAIGKGGSVGLLQITPICVKECNLILKSKNISKRYTLQDRLNAEKSIEMFKLIQEKYNPSHDIEKAIRLWNGGPHYSIKGTQGYLNKVKRHLSLINIKN